MKTRSVAEINCKAIALLCREIGPVDTMRFLSQFSSRGNYAADRQEILGDGTVSELVAEIEQRRGKTRRNGAPKPRKGRRKGQ